VPETVSHYRIVRLIGAGGMGRVYLAEDTLLGRPVALKRLAVDFPGGPTPRQQLIKEARAAAVLNHPNVAVVHDVIEEGEDSFIVMEYVEGESLRDTLRGGALPLRRVIDIGIQLCDALEEAHRHGVIHRDLKPGNVVMTAQGRVKVLDFGLASAHRAPSEATTAGFVCGTPAYMAPEQKLGYRADERSDLFSLGLVLFELAVGVLPVDDRDSRPMTAASAGETPLASDVDPTLPAELTALIAKAMAWDPDARYQSAAELRDSLRAVDAALSGNRTLLRDAGRASRRPRAPRTKLASALSVIAVLAVVSGFLFWNARRSPVPPGPPIVAVLPLANVSGDPTLDHIGVGIAHTLMTKLAAIPSVTTVSRTTAREYGAGSRDLHELANDLGASFVVNGSVQRAGDALQVTVNLVRADDSIAWGAVLEGPASELFDIQRRLAAGVAAGLRLNLTPAEARELEEAPTEDADAYAEFSQGRSLLERIHDPENIDRAIQLLESSIRRDPEFVLAYAALSEAYWEKFERTKDSIWTDRSRTAAEESRRLDPDHPAVLYALAKLYYETGDSDRALEVLERTLELQPGHDDALALRGRIHAESGEVDEGAADIRKAIALRPNFWGHYDLLGLVYYRAGRPEEAIPAFRRVTELQPDLPNGFQSLGATYHSMGALDQAVSNYREAIERGHSWVALSNLGTIYYRRGQFAEAAEQYEKALELNPNRHVTHRNLGDAYQRLGRRDDARRSYERAKEIGLKLLSVNPKEASTMSFLGVIEAKLGNRAEAIRLVSAAAAIAPKEADVWYDRAVVHALAGDVESGVSFLRIALDEGYSRSEARVDDDLASLRRSPEFLSLVDRTE
jgi:tetratricopeptide (TPR) repeat protein/predicted Ser/Thr protein kinase